MSAPLAWPAARADPLHGFTTYGGGFNVLDPDYLAVRRGATHPPRRRIAVRMTLALSLPWARRCRP